MQPEWWRGLRTWVGTAGQAVVALRAYSDVSTSAVYRLVATGALTVPTVCGSLVAQHEMHRAAVREQHAQDAEGMRARRAFQRMLRGLPSEAVDVLGIPDEVAEALWSSRVPAPPYGSNSHTAA